MFSAKLIMLIALFGASVGITGCGDLTDDLLPSGSDKRPAVEPGTMGTQVTQQSPDFSMLNTLGDSRGLSTALAEQGVSGVVLYFTMWCPACNTEANLMRSNIMPNFPNVSFFLVDYVTGSITNSRAAQEENSLTGIETLVDENLKVFNLYHASMGTTVVVDKGSIIRMNELYKDGFKLTETLQALP